ncbi:hypothetical protein [Capnocytophaga canimorsus]|uniref:Na(+)-translocating NADH-quinone reductase subunit F n=2 Tax=Capnocytophaga canimorsus TaxID=28188 RepID=F9YTN7_CAPCC|nr:hypothetical protein [Capnocytophaga canimorsus]AEK24082.1 Conserved hypothetical protein [Capnocytophaga canimorsus Cc5]ATA91638.1 Na(+)-translocating NADH-quinone reductase subunit F [Capnocytophaga canimorsus]ATA93792.1 Na(+)-translocating NADH-quinone reductase subunit F [Capnocytophaga canimorsus]GIM56114.1 hypothetical protein CAPN006_05080 [Capnocytophaga canimorsus]GIM58098.1 hypothetical protein CAPN007_03050 [Capnocytophaga canimorsus]
MPIPLTGEELHYLAMNIVGTALRDDLQWEFLLVNSKLKKDPQFVCVDKNKQKHFIIVRAVPYGEDPDAYDPILMQMVRKHAEKYQAKTYFAGVGLTNIENQEYPIYKNQPYKVNFKGLLEIR